jgi:NADH-quinone oxidoreductase subunit M
LPEAHVEASTPGSVLLAGILLKLGLYGLIIFPINMLPEISFRLAPFVCGISILGAVYTANTAIRQQDLKRVIAYSSVSHMCVATLGLFSLQPCGIQAGLYQGISHGFISVALFILVGCIYDRFGSRDIQKYTGLARLMPAYAVFLTFFTLANLAVPGFSSFVGEFGLLYCAFSFSIIGGLFVLLTVILVGGYSLLLNNRILFGDINKTTLEEISDLTSKEVIISLLLAFFVIICGVNGELISNLFLTDINPMISNLILEVNTR